MTVLTDSRPSDGRSPTDIEVHMHAWGRRGRARPRTLRRTWRSTVGKFVAVIVAVMAVATVATTYQRSVFTDTMRDLESETAALVALDRALLEATGPVTVVLYRAGTPEQVAAAHEAYDVGRTSLRDAFDRAHRALHTGQERAHLAEARRNWDLIDVAVVASPSQWTDAELIGLLATNQDPFVESVWEPYDRMDLALADVRTASVADLKARVADADQLQDLIRPMFVASLGLALVFAFAAARRMTRHVLRPLADVGHGARAMRDPSSEHRVDVPEAVLEIKVLADDINETSATIRRSHGLLHAQAHTDEMTALPNRKAFLEILGKMLESRDHGRVAVLFVDLDDFKDVNDTMGHAAGDALLRVVGRRLRSSTRECEVAARLGGDEFAVAVDIGHDVHVAVTVAERVLEALDHPAEIGGQLVDVGCSIGIAVSEVDADPSSIEELLGSADFAMYMAKSQGKNRHELYSSNSHTEMLGTMELRRDLAVATARQELELHYQPIVDLADGSVLGFEALVRWNHPTRGLLPPNDFIGLAEDTGSICEIGAWVLDEACRHLALHLAEGASIGMSVNVSPVQLLDPEFPRVVVRTANSHGIPLDRLVLEVTESTAMADAGSGSNVLEDLRSLGAHVALDDFGTGFSSLRSLGDLPVDVIKVDRSFVAATTESQRSTLEAIVSLGQRLGLFLVAEGVERPEEVASLNGLGRMAAQGYLFARPLPAEDALAFRRQASATDAAGTSIVGPTTTPV